MNRDRKVPLFELSDGTEVFYGDILWHPNPRHAGWFCRAYFEPEGETVTVTSPNGAVPTVLISELRKEPPLDDNIGEHTDLLEGLKSAKGYYDKLALLCLCKEASHEIEWRRRQVETLQRLSDLQEKYIASLRREMAEVQEEKKDLLFEAGHTWEENE